jgi:hypothetical protein
MSIVNLCRLWYIFPPDDQELKPHEFERKVTSFLQTLSLAHQLAVLDYLAAQYAAFQHQLQAMLARAVLSRTEHAERSERLRQHVRALHACRRAVELSSGANRERAAASAPFGSLAPARAARSREQRQRLPLTD